MSSSADPVMQDNEEARMRGPESFRQVPRLKSWTDTSSRTLCFVPGAGTAFRAGPGMIPSSSGTEWREDSESDVGLDVFQQ